MNTLNRALANIERYPADADYWRLSASVEQLENNNDFLTKKYCLLSGEIPSGELRKLINDNQALIESIKKSGII